MPANWKPDPRLVRERMMQTRDRVVKTLVENDSWWRPNPKRLLWVVILGIPVFLGIAAVLASLFTFTSSLPSLDQLENIEPRLITKLYDKDSNLVKEFFVEKRIWTPIDSMPKIVPEAVMSSEDRNFEGHWGMNLWAIPGAIAQKIVSGGQLRGASTLSQQLAKNLFLTPERSLGRKLKEAMTAVAIEQTYTKQEILEFYLNQVYLGGGNYGFQAACQYYFGIPLDSITISQTAILTAMLPAPELRRPDRHPKEADRWRRVVLYSMRDAGYITRKQRDDALAEPVLVSLQARAEESGGYFVEEVRKYMEKKYGVSSLYSDGVKVYTTIDVELQKVTEAAVHKKIAELQENMKHRYTRILGLQKKYALPEDSVVAHFDSVYALFLEKYVKPEQHKPDSLRTYPDSLLYRELQAAAIVIENSTGAVRAMMGGLDFQTSKFNRAVQSVRQPGSSFKPFVYALAMDNGAAPSDSVNDEPITLPDPTDSTKTWRPENYDKEFQGYMTLRKALYTSANLPAIQTGMKYGLNNLVNYAHKFGLKSKLEAVPSLAIGSVGATLEEMTSAYTAFPNGGQRIDPYLIERIEGRNGEVIEKSFKTEHEVISPASAYLMVSLMHDVNTRGTAAKIGASGFRHPSGGKTGTTNDYTDAWYIGYTKQYTMGIWAGVDRHDQPMGPGHTGGDVGVPIWIEVMKFAHRNLPALDFPTPSGICGATVCDATKRLAGDLCTATGYELFHCERKPETACDGNHKAEGGAEAKATSRFAGDQDGPSTRGAARRKAF
jgi:penicillin-binding protein 1A